jgi:hypothetical protein
MDTNERSNEFIKIEGDDDGSTIKSRNMNKHKNNRKEPKFKLLLKDEELLKAVMNLTADNNYISKSKSFLKARIRESALDYDGYVRAANSYFISDFSDEYQVRHRTDYINEACVSLAFLSSAVRCIPSLIPTLQPDHKELKIIGGLIKENEALINGWHLKINKRYETCSKVKEYTDNIINSDNCPIYFDMPPYWSNKKINEIKYGMDFGVSSSKSNYYNR